jgi:molecular chaperone DnaK
VPQIEVTFELDSNGILNVSARDKATGKSQKITITASTTLSKEEVERMVREAEAHAAEDRRRREEIELKNRADQMVYTAEKTLRDAGEKISPEARQKVENARERLKKAISGDRLDRAEVEKATEQLTQALYEVTSALYGQAAQAGPAPGGAAAPGGGPVQGEVVDAEYEVKE